MRILVIDDHPDTAATQAQLLRLHGYDVDICTHGQEAMLAIEQTRPDVLLLDLAMPKVCGLDIAEELQHCPDLRPQLLIAVTGFETPELRAKVLAAGFDYYFTKPLAFTRLQAVLETAKNMGSKPR